MTCAFAPFSYFFSKSATDQEIELTERNQLKQSTKDDTNPPDTARCPVLKNTVRCCINRPQCMMFAAGLLSCGTGMICVCSLTYGNCGSLALVQAPKGLGITGATCCGGGVATQTGMSIYGLATDQGLCYYPDIAGYCNY